MKKRLLAIFIFCLCLSFAASTMGATERSIKILADPRIELLAVVQYVSGYGDSHGLITRFSFPYKEDAKETFSLYKKHTAVKLFKEMSAAGFTYDAPPAAMLYLSNPPELELKVPFTAYVTRRAGGEKRLKMFVEALRDFAVKTKFMDFFSRHKKTFQTMVEREKENLKGTDYINTLETYYGMEQNSYNIVLAPLFTGAYGPRVRREKGNFDIFNICGPGAVKEKIPTFGSREGFKYLAWHEFSHSFVNPTTEKFRDPIFEHASLFSPISKRMADQAYGNWQTCVNEHVVRAVTTRLAFLEEGEDSGEEAILNEKSRGFFYIDALCKGLEKYEKNREQYPTFVDFYPEIVGVFKELSDAKLGEDFYTIPFPGTLNAVSADKPSVVLIVPTNEKNKAVQERIHSYVKGIKTMIFKDSPVLTDREALKKDLSSNALFVYGTVQGNLWLSRHFESLPVKIEKKRIIANKVFKGTNLRFISAWPSPHNPKKGVAIYTAQKADDIIGINNLFHGPTDFVVAQGGQALESANYRKRKGKWSLK